MVRNGGNTVSDMLASTQEGLQKWTDDNLDGCRSSHIARAVSNSLPVAFPVLKNRINILLKERNAEKLFNFIQRRACSFVNEIHCV